MESGPPGLGAVDEPVVDDEALEVINVVVEEPVMVELETFELDEEELETVEMGEKVDENRRLVELFPPLLPESNTVTAPASTRMMRTRPMTMTLPTPGLSLGKFVVLSWLKRYLNTGRSLEEREGVLLVPRSPSAKVLCDGKTASSLN